MSWCLSNFSILQPLCTCKRTTSLHKYWQYCLKLSSSPQNPTYNTVFNCKFKDLFERKPNQIHPLSIRVQPGLRAVGFVKRNALIHSIPATPPWLLKRPRIIYIFINPSKVTPPLKYAEICSLKFVTITKISVDYTLMALGWNCY